MHEEERLLQNNERPQKQGRLPRFFKHVDRNPYTIQLYYDKKHAYGSTTGGVISFIFYVTSIAIFVVNLISFFKENQLNYSQTDIKNDFQIPVALDFDSICVNITGHNGKQYFLINTLNQEDFGLEVVAEWTSMINGSISEEKKAEDYQGLYAFPSSWKYNLTLKGRSDVILEKLSEYKRLGMYIKITNQSSYSKLKNMTVKVVINSSIVHPKQIQFQGTQKLKTRIFYIRDGFPIFKNQLQELNIYFRRYWVVTDKSYLFPPVTFFNELQDRDYTHFHQQFTTMTTSRQSLSESDKDKIVWIKLKRSTYATKFERQFDKLPFYLSSSFGLIGGLLVLMIPCGGYSKWAFLQRKIQKTNEKKQKINILKYFLSIIKSICRIFKSIKQDKSIITQQFYYGLDIKHIQGRITQVQDQLKVQDVTSLNLNKSVGKKSSSFSQSVDKQ